MATTVKAGVWEAFWTAHQNTIRSLMVGWWVRHYSPASCLRLNGPMG